MHFGVGKRICRVIVMEIGRSNLCERFDPVWMDYPFSETLTCILQSHCRKALLCGRSKGTVRQFSHVVQCQCCFAHIQHSWWHKNRLSIIYRRVVPIRFITGLHVGRRQCIVEWAVSESDKKAFLCGFRVLSLWVSIRQWKTSLSSSPVPVS